MWWPQGQSPGVLSGSGALPRQRLGQSEPGAARSGQQPVRLTAGLTTVLSLLRNGEASTAMFSRKSDLTAISTSFLTA